MIPLCPLLLQARAGMVDTTFGPENAPSGTALYSAPATAPGVACIGSRCAWWAGQLGTIGRCGGAVGGSFTDPAGNQP